MTAIEFDVQKFEEAVRSLYFQRVREEATALENVLIAQVQGLVNAAMARDEALSAIVDSKQKIRLGKLLSGDPQCPIETILKNAADRIEVLESKLASTETA